MPIDQNFKNKKLERPLAIGTDIFTDMPGSYYVDKTLLAKDIIDSTTKVILFTRPRRFGKTLNMTMLQTFFEIPIDGKETSHYFKDLEIWQQGEKYRAEQGKYPVIFITFKDTKCAAYQDTITEIKKKIANEFGRHRELAKSKKLDDSEKKLFSAIKERTAPDSEYSNAFETLSRMLCRHYGEQVLVLIDEYDAPIQAAYDYGFYDKMVIFMRNFLSSVFKTNSNLYRGILTGITRVSKESIFSGLNNLKVNTVFDEEFNEYFGITEAELKEMLSFYGIPEKFNEMKAWYDGYDFGGKEIYNPWSVIRYIDNNCKPMCYWANTSDNKLAAESLIYAGKENKNLLEDLLNGESVKKIVDTNLVFPEIKENSDAIFSLLAQSGYLKSTETEPFGHGYKCKLKIPNLEITEVFAIEIIERLLKNKDVSNKAIDFMAAVITGDTQELQSLMQEYMLRSCSYLDFTAEKDYQNFMLGIFAFASAGYMVKSNREAGLGRHDIFLYPKKKSLPGIIFELKHFKGKVSEKDKPSKLIGSLKRSAKAALRQIDRMKYVEEMKGYTDAGIIKYGAAFYGKQMYIESIPPASQSNIPHIC
ncbi:MAG: AAA family ATPase [Elusimicrobiales bacterium]|nr:AAA family ATPase [Elusimicrobiales bacterium]